MNELIDLKHILAALIYSGIGIVVLLIAFWIVEKITPENVWKQIVEHKNNAVAIVIGAFIIALGIIIASAING
ncbi:MAG: DUF350 domain-containing protein [Bacteroidia bacterium]|jgi:uncharacterized membrane protein YjfL (UPF0719 family)|nr:DUF350 domain-containing protein [Bacteroidia bacterium]